MFKLMDEPLCYLTEIKARPNENWNCFMIIFEAEFLIFVELFELLFIHVKPDFAQFFKCRSF